MQHHIISSSDVLKTVHVIANAQDIEQCITESSGALSNSTPIEDLAAALLEGVLEKDHLIPLHHPEITVSSQCEGQCLDFTARFEVLPHIPVPLNPERLTITLPEPEPQASDLTRVSTRYIKRFSSLEPVLEKRKPHVGDVVRLDIEAVCNGQRVAGMCHKDFNYRLLGLGAQDMEQPLDYLLLGSDVGQSGAIDMPCPPEYPDADVRGKNITLSVTLKEIRRERHPIIDDAFCKRMGFKGLTDFTLHIYTMARTERTLEIESEAKEQLLQDLLRPLDFPLPQCLVNRCLHEYIRQTAASLEERGMDRVCITATLRAQEGALMKQARQSAQRYAFLLALSQFYHLDVSQESMDKAVQRMAAEHQCGVDSLQQRMKESGQWQEMKMHLLLNESLNFLYRKVQKVVAPNTTTA